MTKLIISIDDTDSNQGMCTTYLMTLIIDILKKSKCSIIGYPALVRLNPSIPYKTRGNAALSLEIETNSCVQIDDVISIVTKLICDKSMINSKYTNPGSIFIEENEYSTLKKILKNFYIKAV